MTEIKKTQKQFISELKKLTAKNDRMKITLENTKEEKSLSSYLYNMGPDSIVVIQDKKLVKINRTFTKQLGYTQKDIDRGLDYLKLVPENNIETIRKRYEDRINGIKVPRMLKMELFRKNGSLLYCETSAQRIIYNKRPADLVIIRNISEEINTNKLLRESEELHRITLQNISDAVFITDENGMFTFICPNVGSIFGYSHKTVKSLKNISQILGKNLFDPLELEKWGELKNIEKSVTDKNGVSHFLIVNVKKVSIKDGRILYVCRDITERKNIEDKLRAESENVARLITFSPIIICGINSEGILKYINPAGERATGYSSEEIVGKNWWHTMYPGDRYLQVAQLFSKLKKINIYNYEMNIIAKNGDNRTISWSSVINYDSNGDIHEVIGFGQDITKQKKNEVKHKEIEKQLYHSQKMDSIGTLAAGIAHDFNNIIGAILLNAELLASKLSEHSNYSSWLQNIIISSNRANTLVEQMLTFSRQAEYERRPLILKPVIKEIVKFIRSSLPSTIEISSRFITNKDCVLGDPSQINQIIVNLCNNSAQSIGKKKGKITIEVNEIIIEENHTKKLPGTAPGEFITISVSDNGKGIDKTIENRIFDPFFTTIEGERSGLGLSVVHGIINEYKGFISVDNEPNKRTIVSVFIPMCDISENSMLPESESVVGGNEHILLVEDDELLANIQKSVLESNGYSVRAIYNSIEALETFRADPKYFDLVISDLVMPELTGYELIEKISELNSSIPIILATGNKDLASDIKTNNTSVKKLLTKPLSTCLFLKSIRDVLDDM
jgi:PAS domain S-box-containing protein